MYSGLGHDTIVGDYVSMMPHTITGGDTVIGKGCYFGLRCTIIKEAMLQRSSDEWLAFAKEADIPMVKMQHFSEVSYDEQALVNGYIHDVTYASGVTYKVASSPIEMDSIGELHTEPTKAIGADTAAVLAEHGYTDAQLADLRAAGIIN